MFPGDIHTHVWLPQHMSEEFTHDLAQVWPEVHEVEASPDAHWDAVAHSTRRSVVLAFDAPHSGIVVPDAFVADYVKRDRSRLVGFTSVDPMRPDALARLREGIEGFGMGGVKLAPTYQGFDPLGREAYALYKQIEQYDVPIVWHQGATFVRKSILKYALPHQIDDVAREFPKLRIIIAHLGHPWIDECITVIRKHPRVFADISGLAGRPRQFRAALLSASDYGVSRKLLFGTDYPFATAASLTAALQALLDKDAPADLVELIDTLRTSDPFETVGF